MIHDFNASKQLSKDWGNSPLWGKAYRQKWPGCVGLGKQDAVREVRLKDGETMSICEKIRPKGNYGDVLLEYWTDTVGKVPGWVVDVPYVDYIAYAVAEAKKCYLFEVKALQYAWAVNEDDWKAEYPTKTAQNKGYYSSNVPVPVGVFMEAVEDCVCLGFPLEAVQVKLTEPIERGPIQQNLFEQGYNG